MAPGVAKPVSSDVRTGSNNDRERTKFTGTSSGEYKTGYDSLPGARTGFGTDFGIDSIIFVPITFPPHESIQRETDCLGIDAHASLGKIETRLNKT